MTVTGRTDMRHLGIAAAAGGEAVAAGRAAGAPAGGGAHRRRTPETSAPQRLAAWAWAHALPLILTGQAGLALRFVWANTAFQDEALYLRAGHQELAHLLRGAPVPAFATYFSGAPVLYPVLGAAADHLGGLAAARLLSLGFMLAATALVYGTATRLFGRDAGVWAALLFAVLGNTDALSAFATYDAMALALVALAAYLAVCSARARASWGVLAAAAVVAALAVATKYAAALFVVPVVVLAVLVAVPDRGWWRGVVRGLWFTAVAAGLLGAALYRAGPSYWQGIRFSTLSRAAGTDRVLAVLTTAGGWEAATALAAAAGIVVAARRGMHNRTERVGVAVCVLLASALLLAPAEQARLHTLVSLSKHVVFDMWLAAPVAGYGLARLAGLNRGKGRRVAATALAAAAVAGFIQGNTLFHYWPDSRAYVAALAPLLRPGAAHDLIETDEVVGYYDPGALLPGQVTTMFGFTYHDPLSGRTLTGVPAYRTAIADHYFSVIVVTGTDDPAVDQAVAAQVSVTPGYRLAGLFPYTDAFGPGAVRIWQLAA